jgi:hypothetical protein
MLAAAGGGPGIENATIEPTPASHLSGFARQFRCGFGFVIPAKAGIQKQRDEYTVWMPACAGMTVD